MGFLQRETLIERLAKEMGWMVTDREGDYHEIRPDDGSPLRYLSVRCRDDRPFVTMWINFPVMFPLSVITPELTLGLLHRNHRLFFGRWDVTVQGSCELLLSLHHTAIKGGLTAGMLRAIGREMIGEREALHLELRSQLAGLPRMTLARTGPFTQSDAPGRTLPGGGIVWTGP